MGVRRRRAAAAAAGIGLVPFGLLAFGGAVVPPAARVAPVAPSAVIAHRAGRAHAPENSLAAVRSAAERGAYGVELDIRRGPDGRLVCAHDPVTDAEPARPTLGEALDLALGLGLVVELDLKTGPLGDLGLVREVTAAVAARAARDRVWVSAFHPVAAVEVRLVDPEIALGWPAPSARIAAVDRLAPWGLVASALGASLLEPAASVASDARVAAWVRDGWTVEVYDVPDDRVGGLRAIGAAVVLDAIPAGGGR